MDELQKSCKMTLVPCNSKGIVRSDKWQNKLTVNCLTQYINPMAKFSRGKKVIYLQSDLKGRISLSVPLTLQIYHEGSTRLGNAKKNAMMKAAYRLQINWLINISIYR